METGREEPKHNRQDRIALAVVTAIIMVMVARSILMDRERLDQAIEALGDPSPDVRIAAHQIVLSYGSGAAPKVLAALEKKRGMARAMAALLAGEMKDAAAVSLLSSALSDSAPEVRRSAATALGELKSSSAIVPLTKCLDDPDASVRRNAAAALGQIGSEARPAAPKLIQFLASKTEPRAVRLASAIGLGDIGEAAAVDELVRSLDPKDIYFAKAAAQSLGKIGSAKAVGPLCQFLARPDQEDMPPDVRVAAIESLVKIKDKRAIPTLKVLADESKTMSYLVRKAATCALREMKG